MPFPVRRTGVLLVGGIDPSGGAGLTLDARVVDRCGGFGLPIATCMTEQTRLGFSAVQPIADAAFEAAFLAALEDARLDEPETARIVVKTGLFASPQQVAVVTAAVIRHDLTLVVDPVLGATTGGLQLGEEIRDALVQRLLPNAYVVTPNRPEFEQIGEEALAEATFFVLKGGHDAGEVVVDTLYADDEVLFRTEHPRVPLAAVRGTGCAFASALATVFADALRVRRTIHVGEVEDFIWPWNRRRLELPAAVQAASDFVSASLAATLRRREASPVDLPARLELATLGALGES